MWRRHLCRRAQVSDTGAPRRVSALAATSGCATSDLLSGRRCRRRHHIGRRLAAMAGVATDMDLTVGELRVDVVDHFHHAARHQLLGVLVAGILALNVAEIAPLTESAAHRTHHGTFILSLEDFQVLDRKSTRLNSSHRCISYAV